MFSSPAVAADGTIYFGSYDYYLYALSPSGVLKWKYPTESYVESSPAVTTNGTIYFGSDDYYLYALSPNGSLKWKFLAGDYIDSSPALSSDGTVFVGCYDGYLYAVGGPSAVVPLAQATDYTPYIILVVMAVAIGIGVMFLLTRRLKESRAPPNIHR